MQLVPGIEDSFSASGGELQIGGVSVSKLAEEFGTPLFVYDESIMRRQVGPAALDLPATI